MNKNFSYGDLSDNSEDTLKRDFSFLQNFMQRPSESLREEEIGHALISLSRLTRNGPSGEGDDFLKAVQGRLRDQFGLPAGVESRITESGEHLLPFSSLLRGGPLEESERRYVDSLRSAHGEQRLDPRLNNALGNFHSRRK